MEKVRNLSLADLGLNPREYRLPTGNENDAIIAALRLWQAVQSGHVALVMGDGGPCGLDYFEDVATNAGEHEALSSSQIDALLDECFGVV